MLWYRHCVFCRRLTGCSIPNSLVRRFNLFKHTRIFAVLMLKLGSTDITPQLLNIDKWALSTPVYSIISWSDRLKIVLLISVYQDNSGFEVLSNVMIHNQTHYVGATSIQSRADREVVIPTRSIYGPPKDRDSLRYNNHAHEAVAEVT